MEHDTNPILMIDEDFNKAGLSAIFGTILQERLPGKRIIITNGVFSKNRSFLQDEYLGMINRTFTIEDLIACVIKIAGVKAIKEHLTPAQLERIQKTLEQ